jgi:hypothetical protein
MQQGDTVKTMYAYKSDSDEEKYITNNNRNFFMLSRKAKKIHVRKLWRTLRNKIFSVTRVMSLLESVSTKIVFFGKNSKTIDKNKILRNKSTL